jgi:nucleotide-binding universal stress UspA family protein
MYKSILLPVDLNHESSWEKAVPFALGLAKSYGAKLHVIMVIPDFGMPLVGSYFPADATEKALKQIGKSLSEFVEEQNLPKADTHTHVVQGTIYKEIISAADRQGCDVIVMASHRPSTQDYLLGPNAARVTRHAKQSVCVIR